MVKLEEERGKLLKGNYYKNELFVKDGSIRIRENMNNEIVDVTFRVNEIEDIDNIIKELEQYKIKLQK